ncbi:MAG: pyridoxal phosphate-dependent aminotransferase [Acidobacteriota bacterium]
MTPEISTRAHLMPSSPIRRLMPLADEAKRSGAHVYHLNIGQPDIETPEAMLRRLRELTDRVLCYSPSEGQAPFLDSLRAYYGERGVELHEGEILATTGGSEAILFAFLACADEGEEILVVEPFYTNYAGFAAMAGVRLVPVTSRGRDGFHLPSQSVWDRALTPETRAVLLCNPNNPTGTVYTRDELDLVADFCRRHDLFLISDEVYREFAYDGRRPTSVLELPQIEELAILVDSLSKRYSVCGIRLGCLASRNRQVMAACLRMAQARLSAPGLAQAMAAAASEIGPDYAREINAEYQHRRDVLFEGLQAIQGVFLLRPEGAFYCIARLPVADSGDFAEWLLRDFRLDGATVMIAPASGFYATAGLGMNEIRIAYVLQEEDLRAALRVLGEGLREYRVLRGLTGAEYEREPSAALRS